MSARFTVSSLEGESSKVAGPLNCPMTLQTCGRLSLLVGKVAPDGEGSDRRAPGTSFRDPCNFSGHGWSRSPSQPKSWSLSPCVSLTYRHTCKILTSHRYSVMVPRSCCSTEELFMPVASAYYDCFLMNESS